MYKGEFDHLINNLERRPLKNSIFNYKLGKKAFLSLGQGNIIEWLETLLPNTRLIIEPKIIGSGIGIQYINGKLKKAINESCVDITEELITQLIVPKIIPIKERIEIRGVVYDNKKESAKNNTPELLNIKNTSIDKNGLSFAAFQIFHCNINQYQVLQELKKLNFEIPETEFTSFISDIGIYLQCWKEGRLFQSYPTNGIVVKINSRKLQKYLGENNLSINWAYAIN